MRVPLFNVKHDYVYTAPEIYNVKLWTRFYWYLQASHDGHFQVGRGYRHRKGHPVKELSLFEPWNWHYFNHNKKKTKRVYWVPSFQVKRATLADFGKVGL